jgi:hypothetical protein
MLEDQLNGSISRLMLRHISRIGTFIRKLRPDTKVLMWNDMLAHVDNAALSAAKLSWLNNDSRTYVLAAPI